MSSFLFSNFEVCSRIFMVMYISVNDLRVKKEPKNAQCERSVKGHTT